MLNDLYLKYNRRQSSANLLLLIQEACKMLNGMLKHYNLSWQAREEIIDNCRSIVLVKAMQKYTACRSKFQTHLYWQFLQEIRRVIDYYGRNKRLGSRDLIPLDEENVRDPRISNSNFKDLLNYTRNKVSKNSKEIIDLLLEGYSKRQIFTKLNIKSTSLQQKALAEIKKVLKEAYVY